VRVGAERGRQPAASTAGRRLGAVRWLLIKDLQILRRSPLLVGVLTAYPIAIALLIGFAVSSPPGRPTVALYDAVGSDHGRVRFGARQIDLATYERQLLAGLRVLHAGSQAQAIADVRGGRALAAVIVPADIVAQLESLIHAGIGSPTVLLYINSRDPLERQYVEQALAARVAAAQAAISKQVLQVAISELQRVLRGGEITLLGQSFHLLGLEASRAIIERATAALPRSSPLLAPLRRVVTFASLAIEGLAFAGPVLGSIGAPLTVDRTELAGRTTPTTIYAVAIAVAVSLMFVGMLLAAGMLALERSEHAYPRLARGLVSPPTLLAEKVALAGGCGGAVALVLSLIAAGFTGLDWGRFELWLVALILGGGAFAALGVLVGALARDPAPASLLGFAISLPVAFLALVPGSAVSRAMRALLDVVSFVFPFKPALQALEGAFSGAPPGIGLELLHLAVLAGVFIALARLALRRFGAS